LLTTKAPNPTIHTKAQIATKMPSFAKTIIATLPISTPQLVGEGAALNSIFSDTDNGIGYGIEGAEENIAGNIATLKGSSAAAPAAPAGPGPHGRRQLDKISNCFQAIGNAAGQGDKTNGTTNMLNEINGETTSGAANLGADVD
jgi:hypothetical protein